MPACRPHAMPREQRTAHRMRWPWDPAPTVRSRACRCQLGPEEGSRAKKELMLLWTSRATVLSAEVYGLSFEPHCPMDFLHLSSLTPTIWLPPTIIVQGGCGSLGGTDAGCSTTLGIF